MIILTFENFNTGFKIIKLFLSISFTLCLNILLLYYYLIRLIYHYTVYIPLFILFIDINTTLN